VYITQSNALHTVSPCPCPASEPFLEKVKRLSPLFIANTARYDPYVKIILPKKRTPFSCLFKHESSLKPGITLKAITWKLLVSICVYYCDS